eukprot:COSAG01_NODE_49042_length_375_cov_1.753623_1_plen_27_part_10
MSAAATDGAGARARRAEAVGLSDKGVP